MYSNFSTRKKHLKSDQVPVNLSIVHQQQTPQQQTQRTKVFPQNRKVQEIQLSDANISNSV